MSAYRFRECATCSFHDVEPAICEGCINGDEYRDAAFDTAEFEEFFESREIE